MISNRCISAVINTLFIILNDISTPQCLVGIKRSSFAPVFARGQGNKKSPYGILVARMVLSIMLLTTVKKFDNGQSVKEQVQALGL